MTAKYENVHWENRDGIAIITIDRPKALNALNMATMKELHALFAEVAHDETVDVIILTGAGEKAFVAGADIKEMAAMDTLSGRDWGRFGQAVTQQLEDAPQPVIAAVNGYALGGGCELSLACDFRYASENAQFGQPEVKWGICAGFGAMRTTPCSVYTPSTSTSDRQPAICIGGKLTTPSTCSPIRPSGV